MEQSFSSESHSSWAGQGDASFNQNNEVNYLRHISPLLYAILYHLNPIKTHEYCDV
jgi:hypothetical protein